MIVVDTSAIVAIIFDEPDSVTFEYALADQTVISVANVLELHMVVRRQRPHKVRLIDITLTDLSIQPIDVTLAHVTIARAAFDRYGKGMGHPAQLTYGDCFAYALAKSLGVPLLYKGDDFARTDVKAAVY